MPLTIDEKIAQLQAIRDQHGGDLLVLGIQGNPSLEHRKSAGGAIEPCGIRFFAESDFLQLNAPLNTDEDSRKAYYGQALKTGLVALESSSTSERSSPGQ